MNHVAQGQGVFDDPRHVDHAADVGAAAADEDADLRFFLGDVLLRRVYAFLGQPSAPRLQQLAGQGAGRARGHHRLGNVHRPLEGAADENARAAGLDRVDRVGLAEALLVELDAELLRKLLRILGRVQPDRQHHQFEFLFLDPASVVE